MKWLTQACTIPKTDLPAIRHKEDLPTDKEYINGNADLLLEL